MMKLVAISVMLCAFSLAAFSQRIERDPYDRFGDLSEPDMKARVSSLLSTTRPNGPDYYAMIEIAFPRGASVKHRIAKAKTILWTIDFMKFPTDRVALYIRPDASEEQFTSWIVSDEADLSATNMSQDKVLFVNKLPKDLKTIFTTLK